MRVSLISRPLKALKSVWDNAGMLIVFAVLFVTLSVRVPFFFTWNNVIGLAVQVSMVGMVACTMLFCLASGDFDLSIESVVAFSGVFAAVVIAKTGSISLGILCGVLAGGIVGLINGIVIAQLRINALITTLATMQIVRGLGFIVSDGKAVGIAKEEFNLLGATPGDVLAYMGITPPAFFDWHFYLNLRFVQINFQMNLMEVPNPVWITIACFVLFGFLLNRTTYGRNTLAIGGNKEAARLSGIAVDRIKITIFVVQGLMAGFAGVVLASRMTSGQPNTSLGFSLDVISACVLGGVALSGGTGTILGTLVGVLIMGTVQNAMDLLNIPTFYQYVARGAILLAAVMFDQLKQTQFAGVRPLLLEILTLLLMIALPFVVLWDLMGVPGSARALVNLSAHLLGFALVLGLRHGRYWGWIAFQPFGLLYLIFCVALAPWIVPVSPLTRIIRALLAVLVWGCLYLPQVRSFCSVGRRPADPTWV